ncbi:MAG: response regulator, partial [Rhodobacterales bacterium]|nr:response regulator [Rhodobacterales bacterium]
VIRREAEEKDLALTVRVAQDMPDWVSSDPSRLKQLVVNLLSNAVKFTEQGSVAIEAMVDGHHARGVWLRVAVRDTGVGIDPQVQQRIFAAFEQADPSTTRKFGGTGLGLAICRRLVAAMGGEIKVESTPGIGSTFWFRIPLSIGTVSDRAVEAAAATDPKRHHSQSRILVVDDNELNRMVAQELLAVLGVQVTVASGGHEAIELHARNPFDLIFMDCQMPGLDGYAAARRIREKERIGLPSTRIVAITAHAMATDRRRCLDAGMDDYLSKPVKLDALQDTLSRWLHTDSFATRITPGTSSRTTFAALDTDIIQELDDVGSVMGKDLLGNALRMFIERAPNRMADLRKQVESQDYDAFGSGIHALKGTSGTLGALVLSHRCDELCHQLRANDKEGVLATFARIEDEFGRVQSAMCSLIKQRDSLSARGRAHDPHREEL